MSKVNKEKISLEEIKRGILVFDDGKNFCYKVNNEIYVKGDVTGEVYLKKERFKKEYIGKGNDMALVIYRHLNKDYILAVEECRKKATETLNTLYRALLDLKQGRKTNEEIGGVIEKHILSFKHIKF